MSYCPYYLPDLKTQSHLSGQNLFSHTDRDGHEYIKMYIKKNKKRYSVEFKKQIQIQNTVWENLFKYKYKILCGKMYLNTKYSVEKFI